MKPCMNKPDKLGGDAVVTPSLQSTRISDPYSSVTWSSWHCQQGDLTVSKLLRIMRALISGKAVAFALPVLPNDNGDCHIVVTVSEMSDVGA